MTNHLSSWEDAVIWLRSQPDRQSSVLWSYFDDPLVDAANRYWKSAEWNAIRPLLGSERGQALDIGAGRGIASYALAREGFKVTALEPDSSSIVGAAAIRSLAYETKLPISVTQDVSENLPFKDHQFDVVFARAVLHHTKDMMMASKEFFRVLKPGGLLIAVREHVISRHKDLPQFLLSHPLHHLYGGENAFLLSEYKQAINHAGFQLVSVITPLASVINYAPHSEETLKDAIANQIRVDPVRTALRSALRAPGLWQVVQTLVSWIDNRPGRLYSFVCQRP